MTSLIYINDGEMFYHNMEVCIKIPCFITKDPVTKEGYMVNYYGIQTNKFGFVDITEEVDTINNKQVNNIILNSGFKNDALKRGEDDYEYDYGE